jgi:hypothetical protein
VWLCVCFYGCAVDGLCEVGFCSKRFDEISKEIVPTVVVHFQRLVTSSRGTEGRPTTLVELF